MFSTKTAGRAPLTRRAILTAGVFATHVVVAGLAAFASPAPAGPSASYVLDWGVTSYSRASDGMSGAASITSASTPAATPVTMSVTSAFSGAMYPVTSGAPVTNLSAGAGTIGGTTQQGLALSQSFTHKIRTDGTRANRQTVTFTFSRPVSNLSFMVTDIDSLRYDFWDVVEISGASHTATTDATVSGGKTGPWSQTSRSSSLAAYAGGGNISVHFTAAVTTFTLVYWNKQAVVCAGNGSQGILIGDMSFTSAGTTR